MLRGARVHAPRSHAQWSRLRRQKEPLCLYGTARVAPRHCVKPANVSAMREWL